MTTDEEKDPDMVMVDRHVNQLAEHFESVQVFVTRKNDDGTATTRSLSRGSGNWYASYGSIMEWIDRQRRRTENDEDDRNKEEEP